MLCQRYYEKSYNFDVKPGTNDTSGSEFSQIFTGSVLSCPTMTYKVTKRVAIKPTIYSADGAINNFGEYDTSMAWVANRLASGIDYSGQNMSQVYSNGTFTIGNISRWHWTVDAEL
jgi:hypothetical protein